MASEECVALDLERLQPDLAPLPDSDEMNGGVPVVAFSMWVRFPPKASSVNSFRHGGWRRLKMSENDTPEVSVHIWPFKIVVRGKDAVRLMRWPMWLLLLAVGASILLITLSRVL